MGYQTYTLLLSPIILSKDAAHSCPHMFPNNMSKMIYTCNMAGMWIGCLSTTPPKLIGTPDYCHYYGFLQYFFSSDYSCGL
jgi:hypothetical protein